MVPMGWSWAVKWVQSAREDLCRAGLPGPWLLDKQPGQHIDNFAALGLDRELTLARRDDVQRALADAGVVSNVEANVSGDGLLLGFRLCEGRCWETALHRFWKVALAVRWALRAGSRLSGKELERLVGHLVPILCLRRECLSLLHAAYVFIKTAPLARRVFLWPSVRRELQLILALLPLGVAELGRPWADKVWAVDASPQGYGVVEGSWDAATVGAVGRHRERLRFKRLGPEDGAPRERALEAALAFAGDEAGRELAAETGFPEVLADSMLETEWRVVCSRKWGRKDPILLLKGAVVGRCARRVCRQAQLGETRILILSDNCSCVRHC
jgi:hypothetical protein